MKSFKNRLIDLLEIYIKSYTEEANEKLKIIKRVEAQGINDYNDYLFIEKQKEKMRENKIKLSVLYDLLRLAECNQI